MLITNEITRTADQNSPPLFTTYGVRGLKPREQKQGAGTYGRVHYGERVTSTSLSLTWPESSSGASVLDLGQDCLLPSV